MKLSSNSFTRPLKVAIIAATALATGCAATTKSIDPNEETVHYDANYDFSDKKEIVAKLTDSLLNTTLMGRETAKPIIVTYGIANETAEHINTCLLYTSPSPRDS